MKRVLILLTVLSVCWPCLAGAQSSPIQFRLVLQEDEMTNQDYDQYTLAKGSNGRSEQIFVSQNVLLDHSDIERATIRKKENTSNGWHPDVTIFFKPEAQQKLLNVTTQNQGRRMAVIVDDELIMAPTIFEPISEGKLQINGDGLQEDEDAIHFVEKLGFEVVYE